MSGDLSDVSWNSNSHSQSFTWYATQTATKTYDSGAKETYPATISRIGASKVSGSDSNFSISPTAATSSLTSTISIGSNTGTTARTATIVILASGQGYKTGSATFTITQAGYTPTYQMNIVMSNPTSYNCYFSYTYSVTPQHSEWGYCYPGDPDPYETQTNTYTNPDADSFRLNSISGQIGNTSFHPSTVTFTGSGLASGTMTATVGSGGGFYASGSITTTIPATGGTATITISV